MAVLEQNIEEMLVRLNDNSRSEQNLVRALGDAIRRVDEQLLRDVRNISIQHELRREAILGELQALATRLCVLPSPGAAQQALDHQQAHQAVPPALDGPHAPGGDWRQAAQNIDDELEFALNGHPRH